VIILYILKIVKRGFPPRLVALANIAISLLAKRNLGYISVNLAILA
jgi:hypothetical protein